MNTKLSIILLALFSVAFTASAQTQRFSRVVLFQNDVYLSDNTNTTLRARLSSGSAIQQAHNSNTVTAALITDGTNLYLEVYNWSTVRPSSDLNFYGKRIYSMTNTATGTFDDTSSSSFGGLYTGYNQGDINISGYLNYGNIIGLNNFLGATVTVTSAGGSIIQGFNYGDINMVGQAAVFIGYNQGSIDVDQGAIILGHIALNQTVSASALARGAIILPNALSGNTYVAGPGSFTVGIGTNSYAGAILISNDNDAYTREPYSIYATGGDYSDNKGSIADATGTPAHMTDTLGLQANYWRYTSSTIDQSGDTGEAHQAKVTTVGTNKYFAVYSDDDSQWYFMPLFELP